MEKILLILLAASAASVSPTVIPDVTCFTGQGKSYRGSTAVTSSGRNCQSWSAQTPHGHSYTPENYPNSDLEKNFCRNPWTGLAPWCHTTDPGVRWEYCGVPVCTKEKYLVKLKLVRSSSLDLNDPAIQEDILKQLKLNLINQEGKENFKLSWKKQSDGNIFYTEKKESF